MRVGILLLLLLLVTNVGWAQEGGSTGNCNDGLDNDGDGFIDCYDKECAVANNCKDFFLNHDATCEVKPTEFPKFEVQQLWASEKGSATNHSTVSVGDIIGNDGIPEVVVTNTVKNTITILDGQTGNEVKSINTSKSLGWQDYTAIAIIDQPECGYIFLSGGNTLFAYDCHLNELWRSGSNKVGKCYGTASAISLADFNGDGTIELYYANEIRDALTGEVLIKGSGKWANGTNMEIAAGSVAADVSAAHPGMELIVGLTIYVVDLNSKKLTVIAEHPDYHPKASFGGKQNHNFSSIADYDLDGNVDVIANGALGNPKGKAAIFYWNVAKDELKTFEPPNNWKHGTGRVNIANIDDNPGLNCTFATGKKLYALDEDFKLKWEVPITEKSSGNTGTTVFDFNGDGKSEIVYRDERFLYVIQDTLDNKGNPVGEIRETFPCRSRTGREYPIAADVNGDGQTEICVTCQHPSEPGINPRGTGQVRIFGSKGEKWIPARKLWNQHAYFNVNVNDDLTIPIQQQKHHISFSDFLCSQDEFGNPIPGGVYPLNSFLNQSPYLDLNGCPSYASPDIAFDISPLQVQTPVCPETDFQVSFFIKNNGDVPISNNLNISFYKGDPAKTGSIKLNTQTVTIKKLLPGDTSFVPNLNVEGTGENFDLYISLNDPPTLLECDVLNNFKASTVDPTPFQVYAEKLSDNLVCDGASSANGSARAYAVEDTSEVTVNYTFDWYRIEKGVKSHVYTGADYNFVKHGDYMVKASHDLLGCSSDSTIITIDSVGYWPEITIDEVHKMTNCVIPNGQLKASVIENGTDVSDDFEFTWYEGTQVYVNQTFVGQLASGLSQKTYLVLANNLKNGCSSTKTGTVGADVRYPSVNISDITHITSCNNPVEGAMQAEASLDGATGDPSAYTFTWYEGTIPVDVNEIYNEEQFAIDSLEVGYYTVKVTLDSTQCSSLAVNGEVLDNSVTPTVSLTTVNEKTSCNRPNGVLEAAVTGSMNDYDISWYRGNNTVNPLVSPETVSGTYNEIAENLDAITYTAEARHKVTGCAAKATTTIAENLLNIVASLADINPQTTCIPANGSAEAAATGGLSGNYNYYWYTSHPGSNPDTTAADNTGSSITDLVAADYWLVASDKYEACQSDAVQFTIAPPAPLPAANITVKEYDSCDPAFPNGAIDVSMPGDPDYTIRFFSGQVTHSSFALPGISVPSAEIDPSGTGILRKLTPQIYTVEITDTTTQCVDTASVLVNKVTAAPFTVSAESDSVTFCFPPNGVLQANVAGNTEDYIFNWFIGDEEKKSPNYVGDSLGNINQGNHTVVATNKDNKCKSDPVTLHVDYRPDMSITNITIDSVSSCINPNGELDATASSGAGSTFEYFWYKGEQVYPAYLIDNQKHITNLHYGYYTVMAFDLTTFCTIDSTIYLSSKDILPIADADTINLQSCDNPDGAVLGTVTNPGLDDPAINDASDYTYYWFEGTHTKIDSSVVVDPSLPATLLPDHTGIDWNNITPGFYTVIAEQNTANRCRSFPFTIEVLDDTAPPVISLSSEQNSHCAAPFSGMAMAEVYTPKGQPEPATGYQFDWYQSEIDNLPFNPAGNHVVVGQYDTLFAQQGEHTYSVIVTNRDTQCEDTAAVVIHDNLTIPYFTDHSKLDVLNCFENGKIFIESLSHDAVSDYSYSWHPDDIANPPLEQGGVAIAIDSVTDVTAGEYIVQATHNITSCQTTPLMVSIQDLRAFPAASLAVLAEQISLNPGFQTGEIRADAIEQDGSSDLYNFYWTLPDASSENETLQESDTLINMSSGNYQVVTENVNTLCKDTARLLLPEAPPFIDITDASAIGQILCSTPDGELSVNEVTFNGNLASLADYDFYWYKDNYVADINQNDHQSDGSLPDGDTWFNRPAGEYFIVAREKQLWVETAPFQITLEDNTHIPAIDLLARIPQTDCDPQGSNVNGELTVQVDFGASASDYTFEWYSGKGTSGALLPDNGLVAANLRSGEYSVRVTENSNGCMNEETYFVPLEMPEVHIVASADANKNCDNFNGRLNVTLPNQTENEYHFYWFNGESVGSYSQADYTGLTVEDRAPGDYTVIAVNKIAESCTSEAQTINVADKAKIPVYEITVEAPMTNCDPEKPNAQIRVKPEKQYLVEWFESPDFSNPVITGYVGNHLKGEHTYLVRVSNIYNYCVSEQEVQPPVNPLFIPKPTIVDMGHLTHCETDNGFIQVDVDGNVINYNFEWSNAMASHVIEELPIGSYSVKAIDKFSGCESGLVTVDILDQRVYPMVAVETSPARCDMNDGIAYLEVQNDVPIDYVTWLVDDFEFYDDVSLFEIGPGDHQVTVISDMACATSETFRLDGTIIVYNGISANGDGANDFMKLGCIENYGSNHIQIFNRSGMIVYEAENYDNLTTFFDGHGNQGIYVGEKELPSGTYFYIIDLKDGNEPLRGFVELVRP